MKKGDVEISHLIGGVIAVAVLIIVIFGVYGFYTGTYAFADFIPGFNSTKEGVKGIEILKYDILEDEVFYYDGNKWIGFKGKTIKLGDKEIKYDNIQKNFRDFYYKSNRGSGVIELNRPLSNILILVNSNNNGLIDEDSFNKLTAVNPIVGARASDIFVPYGIKAEYKENEDIFLKSVGEGYRIGDIAFILLSNDDLKKKTRDLGRAPGVSFVLSADDRFWISYSSDIGVQTKQLSNIKGELLNEIYNKMKEWRDGIFKRPIYINYTTKNGGQSNYYCGELKDKKEIIVYLTKVAGKEC